jgi:outer membrane receptor protein involved in Fe transport
VVPKFQLSYQATPHILTYATVSEGFRQGGPNNPAPAAACGAQVAAMGLSGDALTKYGPDHLWNHEIGAKTTWLDQRLKINAALYSIDWDQVQQQIDLDCGFNITANFGKAQSRGGEMEISLVPVDGLTLSSGLGYSDPVLRTSIPGTQAMRGDLLLDTPRWSAGVSAELSRRLPSGATAFLRIDETMSGPANNLYDRSSPFYRRPGYALTDLGAGAAWDDWKVQLFVDNLFNRIAETSLPVAISADLPNTRRESTTRPRTIGMRGRLTF